jgi:hypothetical protein
LICRPFAARREFAAQLLIGDLPLLGSLAASRRLVV